MGLDYTQGCVNFRDVGEFVNTIAGESLMPTGRLLRGGKLDYVRSASSIGSPGTIISLRGSPDARMFAADYYHFPASNDIEKYETHRAEVRKWLNDVVSLFEKPNLHYPILIHCTSGKDRTGIVVAALLRILGIPDSIIIEEYLLSSGEVKEEWIREALDGIGPPETYFKRLDLIAVGQSILGYQHSS